MNAPSNDYFSHKKKCVFFLLLFPLNWIPFLRKKWAKEFHGNRMCNIALTCWNSSLSRSFRSNCVGMERRVGKYLAPNTISGNKPQPTMQYSVQHQKIRAFNDFIILRMGFLLLLLLLFLVCKMCPKFKNFRIVFLIKWFAQYITAKMWIK